MELYGFDVVRGVSGCAVRCPSCDSKCAALARMVADMRRAIEPIGAGEGVVSVMAASAARDGAIEVDRMEREWRRAMPWVRAARTAAPVALAG